MDLHKSALIFGHTETRRLGVLAKFETGFFFFFIAVGARAIIFSYNSVFGRMIIIQVWLVRPLKLGQALKLSWQVFVGRRARQGKVLNLAYISS